MNVQSRRRAYRRPAEFADDFHFIWKRRALVFRTLRQSIPAAFRERLTLTVTEVNGCRICSYAHARLALSAGASQEELRQLLSGSIPIDTPPEELFALTFAQHWAESDAHPDPEVVEKLVEKYGATQAEAIQIVLYLIRMGNLLGNLWDNWLFRLSFGRLGPSRGAG
jgi:AhpD family alkylhydroperoxidase